MSYWAHKTWALERQMAKHEGGGHDQKTHGNWAARGRRFDHFWSGDGDHRLRRILDEFTAGDRYKDPSSCVGECIPAEHEFNKWLADNHPEVGYRSVYVKGADKSVIVDEQMGALDFGYTGNPERIRRDQDHVFSQVVVPTRQGHASFSVDFTYRQFNPRAPHPKVEPVPMPPVHGVSYDNAWVGEWGVPPEAHRWGEVQYFNERPPDSVEKHESYWALKRQELARTMAKHEGGGHDQKTHGKWAHGEGGERKGKYKITPSMVDAYHELRPDRDADDELFARMEAATMTRTGRPKSSAIELTADDARELSYVLGDAADQAADMAADALGFDAHMRMGYESRARSLDRHSKRLAELEAELSSPSSSDEQLIRDWYRRGGDLTEPEIEGFMETFGGPEVMREFVEEMGEEIYKGVTHAS